MLSNLVYYADIGMTESRGGLCFALETGQRLLVFGQVFGQEFHGNKAMQRSVLSLVHHTHPPTAQLLDDAVVRNGLTDHGVQQLWAGMLGVMPRQSQRRLMQDADLS